MEVVNKELWYILGYIISLLTMFLAFKFRLNAVEREVNRLSNVLYQGQGALNIVTKELCKDHRDQIHNSIRKSESMLEKALAKIEIIDQNMVLVKAYLEVKDCKKENEK